MADRPEIVEYAKSALDRFGSALPATISVFGNLQHAAFRDEALDIKIKDKI
jgi:hypothetical protein